MNNPDHTVPRNTLRNTLREKRLALDPSEAAHAAHQLAQQFIQHPLFINSASIAVYITHHNEIDPMAITQAAWDLKKSVYLPALHPTKPYYLEFRLWTPDTLLIPNKYGILEPPRENTNVNMGEACLAPTVEQLDLVLLPLVGFDLQCNRLGVGAGYYDRTFEFLKNKSRPAKPVLIGLAYDFQKIDNLSVESWDIPLDGVITQKSFSCQAF